MDSQVKAGQVWLNDRYRNVTGYSVIVEDGSSGWQTMFALTRALQHELGITGLSDNFGAGTMAALASQIGSVSSATTNIGVLGIVQCALWCKGYTATDNFGTWSSNVGAGIAALKSDMGLVATPSLSPKAFKGLLTMDAYVALIGGYGPIRSVQQWLNSRYNDRLNYFIMPCDGLYSRDVQRGLMYAIQYEIGMTDGVANGNFGTGTQQGIKDYGIVAQGAVDGTKKMVSLFQAALVVNRYSAVFDGTFGATTRTGALTFQKFAELAQTGGASFGTWASLLVSTGDPARVVTASDTSTPLNSARASAMYAAGRRVVGRYLTVEAKSIKPGELDVIFAAGLKIFPIFQNYNDTPQAFNEAAGFQQGSEAALRARQLGFPAGTIIYFAVDYDATNDEIPLVIFPFFRGIKRAIEASSVSLYRVGIYGTRNACAKVSNQGLAVSSFVSGMSTGYSGNLGYPLPDNWTYDQIATVDIAKNTDAYVQIDNDVQSIRAQPVASSDILPTPLLNPDTTGVAYDSFYWKMTTMSRVAETLDAPSVNLAVRGHFVLHWMRKADYWDVKWKAFTYLPESVADASVGVAIGLARAKFEAIAGLPPTNSSVTYAGDIAHFAASTIAFSVWGTPENDPRVQIGDLGAWALDLVTFWNAYETARLNGTAVSVTAFSKSHLGAIDDGNTFDRKDLIADVDAYLVARLMRSDRPVSEALREVLAGATRNYAWRFQQFFQLRFGGLETTVLQAVRELFAFDFDFQDVSAFPVIVFLSTRRPGYASNPDTDPSAAIRNGEIEEIAQAFLLMLNGLRLGTPGR